MPVPGERLLLLVVAYNAEQSLTAVLDRIPHEVLAAYRCEVLVIDDASTDGTFACGLAYRQSRPDLPLRVLRNPWNQGYGGNQKVGYRYAIEEGFDYVALLHGDGQYAPEELMALLQPLAEGSADAVLGSRMLVRGAALKGGMPLYKFVGNKILTWSQNLLAKATLSEWHSGFRVYRVTTLASLRYCANSDEFAFDTEIILQLMAADARIQELPIPTFYGDEICRVDGLRYARDVWRATLRYALHRTGHRMRHDLMPRSDVTDPARDDISFVTSGQMPVVLVGVLERLSDPEGFLEELCYSFGPRSAEIVLTTARGSMPLRMSSRDLHALVTRSGFTVTGIKGVAARQATARRRVSPARILLLVNQVLIAVAPRLFAEQLSVTAESRPHVAHILAQARASAEVGAA